MAATPPTTPPTMAPMGVLEPPPPDLLELSLSLPLLLLLPSLPAVTVTMLPVAEGPAPISSLVTINEDVSVRTSGDNDLESVSPLYVVEAS